MLGLSSGGGAAAGGAGAGAGAGAGGVLGGGSGGTGKTKHKLLPWVEKYRPKSMNDIAFQDEVVHALKTSIATGNLPHLLFYGPPGTGKTSTILAMCRELFGPELMKKRVKEMNASDERGISIIRTSVKTFAQGTVGTEGQSSKYPCPPFKIVILDEADSLTADAQSALRRTMETYTKHTRFCLICNYVSRIIEPVASRCAKFRFQPLQGVAMIDRLKTVAEAEHLTVPDETYDLLCDVSGGDLRKAITTMQSASHLYGDTVTTDAVIEISGTLPKDVVTKLWAAVEKGSFDDVRDEIDDIVCSGYATTAILDRMFDDIVKHPRWSDAQKGRMCEAIAEADKALSDGADESLQLMNVAATLTRAAVNRVVPGCDNNLALKWGT